MAKKKQESYFWTSYSDLMTSLFFVMLVLFVLAIVNLNKTLKQTEKDKEATETQLQKIKEIEESIAKIDTTYFVYNDKHKKHVLNIDVVFRNRSYNVQDIPQESQNKLIDAGKKVLQFMNASSSEVKYLLIIEGQASKDGYFANNELSYNRALTLRTLWQNNGIVFNDDKCEVLVCGSGTEGAMRDSLNEKNNQRFLIHIVPKPGVIETIKNKL